MGLVRVLHGARVRAFPNHHVPPLRSVRLPWLFTHTHHDRLTFSALLSGHHAADVGGDKPGKHVRISYPPRTASAIGPITGDYLLICTGTCYRGDSYEVTPRYPVQSRIYTWPERLKTDTFLFIVPGASRSFQKPAWPAGSRLRTTSRNAWNPF